MKYDFEKLLRDTMQPKDTTPARLSQAVLQQVKEEKNMKKTNKTKFVKAAAIAATVILASGSVVYASSSMWYPQIAKRFGVLEDKNSQQQLEKEGFVDVVQQDTDGALQTSATDKNITIGIEQVVSDQNVAQVYLKATFGAEYEPVEKVAIDGKEGQEDWRSKYFIENSKVTYQGKEVNSTISAVDVIDQHTILYCCYIELEGAVANAQENPITISIPDFKEWNEEEKKPVTVVEGKWSMAYEANCGTKVGIYTLNKKVKILDTVVTLAKLEVTPVSCKLYVKNDKGWKTIWGKDGIVELDDQDNVVEDENGNSILYEMVENTEKLDQRLEEIAKKKSYGSKRMSSILLTGAFYYDDQGQIETGGGKCQLEDENDKSYGLLEESWHSGTGYKKIRKIRFAGQMVDLSDCEYQEIVTLEK